MVEFFPAFYGPPGSYRLKPMRCRAQTLLVNLGEREGEAAMWASIETIFRYISPTRDWEGPVSREGASALRRPLWGRKHDPAEE